MPLNSNFWQLEANGLAPGLRNEQRVTDEHRQSAGLRYTCRSVCTKVIGMVKSLLLRIRSRAGIAD